MRLSPTQFVLFILFAMALLSSLVTAAELVQEYWR